MISGHTKLAGVMGWPVGHSRSPQLHATWLAHYGIDGAYVPLAVHPAHLEKALRALPLLGFQGVNLTVPHKEEALRLIDCADPVALRTGAVNTVVVQDDGSLAGSNTDVFGFRENLKEHGFQVPPNGAATILGAGGAARAVIVALQDMGFSEIRLVNRTRTRAEKCAEELQTTNKGISVWGWEQFPEALEATALLVNATTLGLAGERMSSIDMRSIPETAWVTDVVYTPLITDFLLQAQMAGCQVVDGLGMLLHQARPGFAAWFGVEPAVTKDLRKAVLADDQSS